MAIRMLYSKIYMDHKPPDAHPENPNRLKRILNTLEKMELEIDIEDPQVPESTDAYLARTHSKEYIERIKVISSKGRSLYIDPDTYISEHTYKVARTAFAGSIYAVDMIDSEDSRIVFHLARPPGHHAGIYGRAMGAQTQGFCIFNNVAGSAFRALDLGYKPVFILDFDVHHGNGTQEIFWDTPEVYHIDIHDSSIYPFTGEINDLGGSNALGSKINIPMPPGSSDTDYLYIFSAIIAPIIKAVRPRIILVSAGFDAYEDEFMSYIKLSSRLYSFIGFMLSSILYDRELSVGGIAIVLEGGYRGGLENGFRGFLEGLYRGYLDKNRGFIDDLIEKINDLKVEASSNVIDIGEKITGTLRSYIDI